MSKLRDIYYHYLATTTPEDRFEDSDFANVEYDYAAEIELQREEEFRAAGGGGDDWPYDEFDSESFPGEDD